jgi:hypothetical protein
VYVLIDWDNLEDRDRRSGAKYVADRLWQSMSIIDQATMANVNELHLRLYGGWNSRSAPTSRAAQVEADLQQNFPFLLRDPQRPTPIKVSGELAHSLIRLPRHTLLHTFRLRQGPPKLQCQTPNQLGCASQNCPIGTVHSLFDLGRCPEPACVNTVDQVLTRAEQKLVDTMLVSDLIHFAASGEAQIAVVSSDDDLWPGLLTALDMGSKVVHVRPKNQSTHRTYLHSSLQRKYSHGGL